MDDRDSLGDGCTLDMTSEDEVIGRGFVVVTSTEGKSTIGDDVTSVILLELNLSITDVDVCTFGTLEPSPEAMLEDSTREEESPSFEEFTTSIMLLDTAKESDSLDESGTIMVELKESGKLDVILSVKTRRPL